MSVGLAAFVRPCITLCLASIPQKTEGRVEKMAKLEQRLGQNPLQTQLGRPRGRVCKSLSLHCPTYNQNSSIGLCCTLQGWVKRAETHEHAQGQNKGAAEPGAQQRERAFAWPVKAGMGLTSY